MRNKILVTALIFTGVLIIVGAILAFTLTGDSDVISVSIDPQSSESIRFEKLGINPGDTTEYDLEISSNVKGEATVTFRFVESEEGELKNFVYAKLYNGEELIDDVLLSELIGGKTIQIDHNFKDDLYVTIEYYMPLSVGNEAQNTTATFDLNIGVNVEEQGEAK